MNEDWDFYLNEIDGHPASTFFNLAIHSTAPNVDLPNLGYLRIFMNTPNPDGLSSDEEFDMLSKLEDTIAAAATKDELSTYVGRNTTRGYRDYFFYTGDTEKFTQTVIAAAANFAEYKVESGSKSDPDWDMYLKSLYPPAPIYRVIMNRRVCEQLKKHGDKQKQPRDIDHSAVFDDKVSAKEFAKYLKTQGFTVNGISRVWFLSKDRNVEFMREDAPDEIDSVTTPLLEILAELGGEYDGWGCRVVT